MYIFMRTIVSYINPYSFLTTNRSFFHQTHWKERKKERKENKKETGIISCSVILFAKVDSVACT